MRTVIQGAADKDTDLKAKGESITETIDMCLVALNDLHDAELQKKLAKFLEEKDTPEKEKLLGKLSPEGTAAIRRMRAMHSILPMGELKDLRRTI